VFNGLGWRPRRARQFGHRIVRHILTNETLSGRWTYAKNGTKSGAEPVVLDVPRIISAARYQQLQLAIAGSSIATRSRYRTYPLSKRLYGKCGSFYYGQRRADRDRPEYLCRGRLSDITDRSSRCQDRRYSAYDLEFIVWEQVCELLGQPERLLQMARDFLGMRGEQVQVERDQLAVIDRKIENLTKALTERTREALRAGLPAEVLAEVAGELTAEREALIRHRDRLKAWEEQSANESAHMRRLWDLAEMAHARLPSMGLDEQKQVLGLLDIQVTILEHATRETPAVLTIEGAVHDALLDAPGLEELPDRDARGGMPFRLRAAVE
jgi:site-specific DNA recombinase